MATAARTIHLLFREAGGRLLVDATEPPALPSFTIELASGQTTVQGAIVELRDRFGIRSPLLEVHFDYAHDDASGPIPVLTTMEPDRQVELHDGFAWHDLDGPDPSTDPALRPRLEELLGEWRAGSEPPPLRPRWSRPGWYARARGWLAARLVELGRGPVGEIEQIRHWGISALLRAQTPVGHAWLKAVFPPFHHEPAVTRLLAEAFPGVVPMVLATEPEEGWLVLDDLGAATIDDAGTEADWLAAPRALVAIQRAMASRTVELVELGCPVRPLARLPRELRELLAERPRLPGVTLDPATSSAAVERVESAVAALTHLGLPETLVHGDFHAGNVALVDGRAVIFDWSDAAVGHPLVDAITWLAPIDESALRQRAWDAFAAGWLGVAEATSPPSSLLSDALVAGAAYQSVSYAGIVRNIEPLRRWENADGLEHFLGRILTAG